MRNRNNPHFQQHEEVHKRFWEGLLASASLFDEWHIDPKGHCALTAETYKERFVTGLADSKGYPRINDFRGLPYLYTAAAAFLTAAGESEAAVTILHEAEKDVGERVDYGYLNMLAQIMFEQGRPAADIDKVYERIRTKSIERQKRLVRHCDMLGGCDPAKKAAIDGLLKRHRVAEIIVMNETTFNLAQDLGRGLASALPLEAKVKAFATRLKELDDKNELLGLDRFTILDTYAYARIVLEARSSNPDIGVFRQMRRLLQDVVAELEGRASQKPNRQIYRSLHTARLHLQSARELAGE